MRKLLEIRWNLRDCGEIVRTHYRLWLWLWLRRLGITREQKLVPDPATALTEASRRTRGAFSASEGNG